MKLFNRSKKEKKIIKIKDNGFVNKIRKIYSKHFTKNHNQFSVREVVFVMLITFFFGIIIGGVIMFGKGTFSSDVSDSLNEFADTYEDILDTYYKDIDAKELLQSGIEGLIDYLGDPYAAYMESDEAKAFNEKVEGEYSGIGAEVKYEYATGVISIGNVFKDSPADKAGLKSEDVLISVDGVSIEGKTTADIATLVKGKKGTDVKLKVKRGEEEIELTVKRGLIDIESVKTKVYEKNDKKVGYISISIFASNTDEQFEKKIKELEDQNIDSLIIDVRDNSGGYLTTVTEIISLFTKKGSVIYQLKTKGEIEKIKDKTTASREYPICVLVNGNSASASEVLTAALKENYGAEVIGTKTFGKGKVQKAYSLSNGATVKYTFQEWLTPSGKSIDSVGVEPNNVIEYVFDGTENDNQLQESLNEITK